MASVEIGSLALPYYFFLFDYMKITIEYSNDTTNQYNYFIQALWICLGITVVLRQR